LGKYKQIESETKALKWQFIVWQPEFPAFPAGLPAFVF
jgi:hypothetical protein